MTPDLRAGLAVLLLVTLGKLGLAAHHDLLADEAYYWVWAQRPAWGYYDQPPLIAWALALMAPFETPLGLRLPGVLLGAFAPLLLLPWAGDRALWLVWWAALPPLCWLGLFATPDALLLPLWALALAGALRGGRGWLLCGLATGLAFLTKHNGIAALPLLLLAAEPAERRQPWPWLGMGLAALLAAPNVAWNALHGWVTVGFQLREGLVHPHPPGLLGPVQVVLQQLGVVTPIAAVAGLVWLVRPRTGSRTERMAWFSAAPLLGFFVLAAMGGPPDAHWPAPAWIGVGLGLSHAGDRLRRAAWLGVSLALTLDVLLAVHSVHPLVPLPEDPGDRLREGALLAEQVERWVVPEGGGGLEGVVILTERYQEASLLAWHGLPARAAPDCGRPDQYDLWPQDPPDEAWFVRPATSGPHLCTDDAYAKEGPWLLLGVDDRGRTVGRWQLFRLVRAGIAPPG